MNNLTFVRHIYSKRQRKRFSKLLKTYQFNCSSIQIKLKTIPNATNIHKYHLFDSNSTLREDTMRTISALMRDGYEVWAEVKVNI